MVAANIADRIKLQTAHVGDFFFDEGLVEASATKGERLQGLLRDRLGDHGAVGEIRGRGLMVGLELVADRDTSRPYPRAARVT